MAKQTKKVNPLAPYIQLAIRYSPIWVPIAMVFVFLIFIVWPASKKLSSLSRVVSEKENIITTVNRSNIDIQKTKEDLAQFKVKVVEFEKRLPVRFKTNLIIETLREITRQSKLKFSSLEPTSIKSHELKETNDVFVELPVRVKLNCGYYDLVDFLKKIEKADQLMKVSDLTIRDDPRQDFEHSIEFSISAFSREESGE